MRFWLYFLYGSLGFLSVLLIFDRATRKYLNPFKLYFIFGKKGAGKTTYETKLAYQYLKKGWNVYTDLPELFVPGIRFFEHDDLGDFVPEENSLLILGEAGIKFDNRNFKAFKPSLRDFFAFQRKYKVICYMDSQTFDVDKKIRDRTDAMFLQVNVLRVFSVGKRIVKKIKLVEATAEGESRIAEDLAFAPFWMWTLTYIPRWAGRFDSNAVIDRKPYLNYKVVGEDIPLDAPSGSRLRSALSAVCSKLPHKKSPED